jgi:hypothetical protein
LHVDDAAAVASLAQYPNSFAQQVPAANFDMLVEGPPFTVVHSRGDALTERERWVVPLDGRVRAGGVEAGAGDCLLLQPGEPLEADGARLLIAASA